MNRQMTELNEWSKTSNCLRRFGLPSVQLIDPKSYHEQDTDDVLIMSLEASAELRKSITTLLDDCDRRQALLQELMHTNTVLRNSLTEQETTAASSSQSLGFQVGEKSKKTSRTPEDNQEVEKRQREYEKQIEKLENELALMRIQQQAQPDEKSIRSLHRKVQEQQIKLRAAKDSIKHYKAAVYECTKESGSQMEDTNFMQLDRLLRALDSDNTSDALKRVKELKTKPNENKSKDQLYRPRTSPSATRLSKSSQSKVNLEESKKAELQTIVTHFMQLFEVRQLCGVIPRMSELYTKLAQTHNSLRNIRLALGLGERAPVSDVVETVRSLVESARESLNQSLNARLLMPQETLIRRLEHQAHFLPVFEDLITRLMASLDVQRMDQILPAVRSLKLLANQA